MFDVLRTQVERDVAQYNAKHPQGRMLPLQFLKGSDDHFRVVFYRQRFAVNLDFRLIGDEVTAATEGQTLAEAKALLTDEGEALFKMGDDHLRPWQFARRVLEPLLFPH